MSKIKIVGVYTALILSIVVGLVLFFVGFGKFWDGPLSGDIPWYGLVGLGIYLTGGLVLAAVIGDQN